MLPPKIINFINNCIKQINDGADVKTQNEDSYVIVYFNDSSLTIRPTRPVQEQKVSDRIDFIRCQ